MSSVVLYTKAQSTVIYKGNIAFICLRPADKQRAKLERSQM